MTRLPWFPCYPSKLLGALAGLPPDQQLVYQIILLRIYEVRGPCPDPISSIARRTGINQRRVETAIEGLVRCSKLFRTETGIMNPYAAEILVESDENYGKRSRAGAKGGTRAAENRKQKQPPPPSPEVATGKQEDLDLESKSVGANAPTTGEPVLDVRTRLFRSGLETLQHLTGKPPNACRTLIGKWLGNVDDDALVVLRAIEDAAQARPADPVAWILGALRSRMQRTGGGRRETRNGAASLLVRMLKQQGDDNGVAAPLDDTRALPAGDARRH